MYSKLIMSKLEDHQVKSKIPFFLLSIFIIATCAFIRYDQTRPQTVEIGSHLKRLNSNEEMKQVLKNHFEYQGKKIIAYGKVIVLAKDEIDRVYVIIDARSQVYQDNEVRIMCMAKNAASFNSILVGEHTVITGNCVTIRDKMLILNDCECTNF